MKPLVGNELLILKLVQEKPREFGELLKESKRSRSIVSKHLRSLQKRGRVIRNAERKYVSLKPQVKDSDIPTSLKREKFVDEMVGWVTLLDDALSLTAKKEIQIWLKASYVKGTFYAILSNIAKIANDAFEIKDLFQIQIITRRFLDEYFMPSLQLLVMETREFMENMTELMKEKPDEMKKLLKEEPEFTSFLKRPFGEKESEFYNLAESAFMEFIGFYGRLREARDKRPGVELTLEDLL
jgi:DNA-binding HxlR family transcriptional regulator